MDVKLPPLGEGADSGTVVNLFVKEGDSIAQDQPVLELENKKAVATIPSTATGTVSKIFVKTGDKVSVGQKIISVSEGSGKPAKASRTDAEPAAREPAPPTRSAAEPAEEAPAAAAPASLPPGIAPAASPAIRRLARDLGIDLAR